MTAIQGPDRRDVLPRWRPFGRTVRSGELAPLTGPHRQAKPLPETDLSEARFAFQESPGLHTAGDLLGQAAVAGTHDAEAVAAARFIGSEKGSSDAQRYLARWFLTPNDDSISIEENTGTFNTEQARARVKRMRGIVRAEPLNAVRWVDLALSHLNLGAIEAAEREVMIALQIAPGNRYVLRSAARFFVLLGDSVYAQHILGNSAVIEEDPWLLATELAVSEVAGRPSRNIRRARSIIERSGLAPWDLSELASALATTELRSGSVRKARKLMRFALVEPTENVVAQAKWASKHGIDNVDKESLDSPESYEARALSYAQEGQFLDAVEQASRWLADQPFDPEPAMFTSYVATVGTEQYDIGAEAARRGLVASPEDSMLRNNLVFALASAGRIAEATRELQILAAATQNDSQAATLTATRGLVAFRSGNPDEGRRLYSNAIQVFTTNREDVRAALATALLAREELLLGSDQAPVAVLAAASAGRSVRSPEVDLWLNRIRRMLEEQRTKA